MPITRATRLSAEAACGKHATSTAAKRAAVLKIIRRDISDPPYPLRAATGPIPERTAYTHTAQLRYSGFVIYIYAEMSGSRRDFRRWTSFREPNIGTAMVEPFTNILRRVGAEALCRA